MATQLDDLPPPPSDDNPLANVAPPPANWTPPVATADQEQLPQQLQDLKDQHTAKAKSLGEVGTDLWNSVKAPFQAGAAMATQYLGPGVAAVENMFHGDTEEGFQQRKKAILESSAANPDNPQAQAALQTVGQLSRLTGIPQGVEMFGQGMSKLTGTGQPEDWSSVLNMMLPKIAGPTGKLVGKGVDFVKSLPTRYNAEEVAARTLRNDVGDTRMPAVINALDNAEPTVPGEQPTAAGVLTAQNPVLDSNGNVVDVRGLPGGSAVRARQQWTLQQKGGPSGEAEQRWQDNEDALAKAEQTRNEVTAPLRERALNTVERNTQDAAKAAQDVQDAQQRLAAAEAARIDALQKHGQVQTMAAQAEANAARTGPRDTSIIGQSRLDRVPTGPDMGPAPDTGLPQPGVPMATQMNREAMSGDLGDYVKESAANVMRRTDEVRQARQDLADAQTAAAKAPQGLQTTPVIQTAADVVRQHPGNPNIQTIVGPLVDHLRNIANDPRQLYDVRKYINQLLETRAIDSNYSLINGPAGVAGALRTIRDSIDAAMLKAGGKSWGQYLQTFSQHSNKIDTARLIQDKMYKPQQPTSLGENATSPNAVVGDLPHKMGFAFANWAKNLVVGNIVGPKTAALLTQWMLNPTKMAADLRRLSPAERLSLAHATQRAAQAGALGNNAQPTNEQP